MSEKGHDRSRRALVKAGGVLGGALGVAGLVGVGAAHGGSRAAGLLEGKVALVTGAARGIGRAIALEYARQGASVVMFDVADPAALPEVEGFRVANEQEFEQAYREVRAVTAAVTKVKGDVRRQADLDKAVRHATETFGGLDVVVANAGYVRWHGFEDGTDLDWHSVFDVNVHGVFRTFKAAIPALKARGGGRLIAMSSIGGRQGVPGNGAYTASKWAVIGMVKQAAMELGGVGITVNAIAPGPVDTPMYRSAGQLASMGVQNAAAQDEVIGPMLPLNRGPSMDPSEIADVAVFLASPLGAAISGASLDVAYGYNASYTA